MFRAIGLHRLSGAMAAGTNVDQRNLDSGYDVRRPGFWYIRMGAP